MLVRVDINRPTNSSRLLAARAPNATHQEFCEDGHNLALHSHVSFLYASSSLADDTWARSYENVSYAICEQQRRRPVCASAQSDQHFCCSLLK